MSQIMETEHFQTVLLYHLMEIVCDRIRTDELAERITAHKALKLGIVILAAELFIVLIHFTLFKQHFLDVRYQRKCTSCEIGFQSCLHKELRLAVLVIVAYDLTLDRDSLFLEVDRIPLQTENLT